MGKAAIQAQINEKNDALSALSSEIAELEASKSALSSFSTDVKYILENHEHIKATYYLAGTPYLQETRAEEGIISEVGQSFSGKKEEMIEKLATKIAALELEKLSIGTSIKLLEVLKGITKED
jgi:hypothetical protein